MNKKNLITTVLLLLTPLIAHAESMSFTPPTTDLSVIFLSNMFGIVDGVLHGTGSQIVGQMFAVFNAAVLALGGIVLVYVIIVGTLNTASQGEALGQKWSSIWTVLRLVIGLGMLVPKASGYCLLQVILMWIVVQGVGAADKVWNAALSYLNRGGVIVQANIGGSVFQAKSMSNMAKGASIILQGQVCMLGIQKQLEAARTNYQNSGACNAKTNKNYTKIKILCENSVPNLLNSVNAVGTTDSFVNMPNLDSSSKYQSMMTADGKGICGQIKWSSSINVGNLSQYSSSEQEAIKKSRAIAVQQMYMDLATVANVMVQNDPQMGNVNSTSTSSGNQASSWAKEQFGVPMTTSNEVCSGSDSSSQCVSWGGDATFSTGTLFSGTEFQGAIADYNGIMTPTLTLMYQQQQGQDMTSSKKFISQAEESGWLLAGSYFYKLASLNTKQMNLANPSGGGALYDTESGLEKSSEYNTSAINCTSDSPSTLCQQMSQLPRSSPRFQPVLQLMNNSSDGSGGVSVPDKYPPTGGAKTGDDSLTVNGYINNASLIVLPDQAGFKPPAFKFSVPISISVPIQPLPKRDFGSCGAFGIPCYVATLFWEYFIRSLYNSFLIMVMGVINSVVMSFIQAPLSAFGEAFNSGLQVLQTPNINPVIALAKMGSFYINYSMNTWIELLVLGVTNSLIMPFGLFVGILIMMAMPLIIAWTGTMLLIGFATSYYVPFLPYMIFTFGSIAWIIGVIEAMVAGPIVALGVTHPEGHEVLGKADQAVMLILNVFLRPTMMIIGYITAIALTYVGVWILNAGFGNAVEFLASNKTGDQASKAFFKGGSFESAYQTSSAGYVSWAAIYAQFFGVLIYTSMYLTIVQKAFTLITHLPDKVLRWVGSQSESLGEQSAQWTQDTKGSVEGAGKETDKAGSQITKKAAGLAEKGKDMLGQRSTPSPDFKGKAGGGSTLENAAEAE